MMDGIRRVVFQGSPKKRDCLHLDQIAFPDPVEPVCPQCRDSDQSWVHVRMCLICGHAGCCDSTKPQLHARRHYEETGHALIRSVEPGEDWAWCYEDRAYIAGSQYLY